MRIEAKSFLSFSSQLGGHLSNASWQLFISTTPVYFNGEENGEKKRKKKKKEAFRSPLISDKKYHYIYYKLIFVILYKLIVLIVGNPSVVIQRLNIIPYNRHVLY